MRAFHLRLASTTSIKILNEREKSFRAFTKALETSVEGESEM